MDLKAFTTKYGTQATEELLDIALIKQFNYTNNDWRMFCIRHGIIKQSTKIIQIRCAYRNSGGEYNITLANGRGEWVLYVLFHTGNLRD